MASYDKTYFDDAYGHIKDDADYGIRAAIAYEKYFADMPDICTKNVLEIGAGLGKNIYCLKNAHAYDTSDFSKEFCRQKNIKVVDAVEANVYDVIALIHSLEHMREPLATLKDVHSKLKKGGMLLLVLPFEKHKHVASFRPDTNNHLYSWNFRAINNLLHEAGFAVTKNEFIFEGIGYKQLKCFYKKNPVWMYKITKILTALMFRVQRELKVVAIKN